MKLFPNQIAAIDKVLHHVLEKGKVLDHEIKEQIDLNPRWGSRDRKNVYRACYDIVRNYELIQYLSQQYQSSIIETYIRYYESTQDMDMLGLDFSTQYSIPSEVYHLYQSQNESAEDNLIAMHRSGNIYLRVNTSLTSYEKFVEALVENNIPHKLIPKIDYQEKSYPLNAIQLYQPTGMHRDFFERNQRFYEIQDIGSQLLTEFISLHQVKTVIESCAGNGGKTAHLLDKRRVDNPLHICFDSERKKLEHLTTRISKWKDHKVVTEMSRDKDIAKYHNMADILYMDVPCTGSGTLRRQADLKYRISEKILAEKVELQQKLILQFHPTLKSGGRLVYTTCSLFREENEHQISYIESQGYRLDCMQSIEPCHYDGDGFFIAILEKK